MNKPLYEIATGYQEALSWMLEEGESEQIIEDSLVGLEGDFQEKATNITALFLSIESEAKEIREAERKMAKRRQALEKSAAKLRYYLLENMQKTGIKEVKSPQFSVKLRKNPARVSIDNLTLVPEKMKIWVASPDKIAIKEAIKKGGMVPGASLVQGFGLLIK